MSTILESVNTLSEKLGVTEREMTIKDQLDLCVERLGGEGNSKDIAESTEKFAEKEDGTATFMTKNITENNTYNAADDGVSGYSSVTVEVPSGPETFDVTIDLGNSTSNKTYSETITAINNGSIVNFMIEEGGESVKSSGYYLCDDAEENKIIMVSVMTLPTAKIMTIFIKWTSDNQITQIALGETEE